MSSSEKRYHSLMQQKRNGRAIKESLTSSEIIVNTLFRRYKRNSPPCRIVHYRNIRPFQCRDESEVLRAIHMIEVHGFYSALKKDILDNLSFSAGIMKLDSVQLKSLVDFLNSHDGYHLEFRICLLIFDYF